MSTNTSITPAARNLARVIGFCYHHPQWLALVREKLRAYPSELTSQPIDLCNPRVREEIRQIRERVIAMSKEIDTGSSVDLGTVAPLASAINPLFKTDLAEWELSDAGSWELNDFLDELNAQIFLPAGEYLGLVFDDSGIMIKKFAVKAETWESFPYLNTRIWTAEVRLLDGPKNSNGFTVGRFAFRDTETCLSNTTEHYLWISQQSFRSELEKMLQSLMREGTFTQAEFLTHWGKTKNFYHERKHAADNALVEIVNGPDLASGEPLFTRADTILKPDSPMRTQFWTEEMDNPTTMDLRAVSIMEFSAALGGIIDQMENYLQHQEDRLAYLIFLNFILNCGWSLKGLELRAEQGKPASPRQAHELLYAQFIFVDLGLILLPGKKGATFGKLLNALYEHITAEEGYKSHAHRALDLCRQIYKKHFYTAQEQATLVANL